MGVHTKTAGVLILNQKQRWQSLLRLLVGCLVLSLCMFMYVDTHEEVR